MYILSLNMREQRMKLGYDLNDRHVYSLRDAIPHLEGKQFNPEKEFFEFLIEGSVVPEEIKALTTFPYEVAITEADGKLILSTGTINSADGGEGFRERRDNSRTSFHTHPANGGEIPVITPSFSDVYLSEFAGDKTTLGLSHPNGIMVYRKPAYDPDTNTSCEDKEVRNVVLIYCKNRGIDVLGGQEGLKRYWDLSDAEKVKLQRQFVEETKMIVDEASWNDQTSLERVLSQIFGRLSQ